MAAAAVLAGEVCVKSTKLGLKSKRYTSFSGRMRVKAGLQSAQEINGSKNSLKTGSLTVEDGFLSLVSVGINPMLLETSRQIKEEPAYAFDGGELVHGGLIFRQSFSIRSYEVGADKTCSMVTVMNHLQETSLNHARVTGVLHDGFGVTQEMSKRGLVWVVAKLQVVVERYPVWEDVVEIDSWVSSAGKHGMRREWYFRDARTGRAIASASSTLVMMNRHTRRLSKMPEEVKAEITPFFFERESIMPDDDKKLSKIDEEESTNVLTGLKARWTDLDCNQHVNNVKYIHWLLNSVPASIMESRVLVGLVMEYRKECQKGEEVRSLTTIEGHVDADADDDVECSHLLRLESGPELVRGRTTWRSRPLANSANTGEFA
ncbi:palmitoyl-acyl carrier protein thioesterase, chloroplastic-like [Wolffia australiana]